MKTEDVTMDAKTKIEKLERAIECRAVLAKLLSDLEGTEIN